MYEEVTEVLEAETREQRIEECCDVIISTLTYLQMNDVSDKEFKIYLDATLSKVERRANSLERPG